MPLAPTPLPANTPQRVVIISIITVTNTPSGQGEYHARYTHTSPVTGSQYLRAQSCDLWVSQPTCCLFVLDFDATAAGWTIQGITPSSSSPTPTLIWHRLGAENLSILTYDPFDQAGATQYAFSICYNNPAALNKGKGFCEDPQERNGPRVDSPTP
jgi:hypothetical protein